MVRPRRLRVRDGEAFAPPFGHVARRSRTAVRIERHRMRGFRGHGKRQYRLGQARISAVDANVRPRVDGLLAVRLGNVRFLGAQGHGRVRADRDARRVAVRPLAVRGGAHMPLQTDVVPPVQGLHAAFGPDGHAIVILRLYPRAEPAPPIVLLGTVGVSHVFPSLPHILQAHVPVRPGHERVLADTQRLQDVRIVDVELVVAEVGGDDAADEELQLRVRQPHPRRR